MWCLISQPNSVIFEVRVDPKAIGQDCLQKVCQYLDISNESDYLGLKYESTKGEELWLNLRNPIDRQVNCHGHISPLRFALRVKFWVPPHLLLEESTRHVFYLQGRVDLAEKRLQVPNWSLAARVIALIAQADSGDYDHFQPPHHLYMQLSTISTIDSTQEKPQDLLQLVISEHVKCASMKPATAEYWLLKEISAFENFGEELFRTKSLNNALLGIGPQGITIYSKPNEKQVIPFTAIQSASSHKHSFRLGYLSIDNIEANLEVKLDTSQAANGLYRAITEKHAFYSCETVRSAVTTQFIRDLKGTIVSIFNEDSSLGKKYVFDIRRTCREVYDNARRALYQEDRTFHESVDGAEQKAMELEGTHSKNSHEQRLTRLMDAMTCKICMDNQIDTAFLPCAHVVACSVCASRCDRCPVCRGDISHAQKIYLPGEFSIES